MNCCNWSHRLAKAEQTRAIHKLLFFVAVCRFWSAHFASTSILISGWNRIFLFCAIVGAIISNFKPITRYKLDSFDLSGDIFLNHHSILRNENKIEFSNVCDERDICDDVYYARRNKKQSHKYCITSAKIIVCSHIYNCMLFKLALAIIRI